MYVIVSGLVKEYSLVDISHYNTRYDEWNYAKHSLINWSYVDLRVQIHDLWKYFNIVWLYFKFINFSIFTTD
jgi:hypothetical protein